MSDFGIYFGPKVINITEVKKEKLLTNISIVQTRITGPEEPKVPDEIKLAPALRGEFIKNKISPSNVNLTLPGEDVIIRTFDLPIFLSKREIKYDTIAFEAKKYIPFDIEDIVFDFRRYPDRKNKKNIILFVGIKKEILKKYINTFKQLHIQIRLIEYAGFSILRLLRLGGLNDRGIFGLLNADLEEETNFLVCEDGFPLFSRDINLIPEPETENSAKKKDFDKEGKITSTAKLIFIEKLKSEIRISLDFFRRKFPTKLLKKIIILTLPQFQTEIATSIKDLGLSTVPLEVSKFLGNDLEFRGALTKSYSAAISHLQRLRFSTNLVSPAIRKDEVSELPIQGLPIAITAVKINFKAAFVAFLIIFLTVGWGIIKRLPLENELRVIRENLPKIEGVPAKQNYKALLALQKEYSNKINTMEDIVKNKFYLTEAMDIIPLVIPRGAWLSSLSFRATQNQLELDFEGMVFLADSDKEFTAVNDIALGLKNDNKFSRSFKKIEVVSMQRHVLGKIQSEVTKFKISCR